jgi:RNA polymerase sigma factor (sigma-70 family)
MFLKIEAMADKVFGWALRRTYSREEAEELSQEILLCALKSLPELRDPARFNAWFWRLADISLRVFRRGKGRQRAYLSFDEVNMPAPEYEQQDFNAALEDESEKLRQYIAELSAGYRDVIILHYYDNLTCKTISQRLGLPEGTVTYRLSLARNKLRSRMEDSFMKGDNMNETALKPQKLTLTISGSGSYDGWSRPFPWQYINDALSQNILCQAYRQPKTIEELSILTGVPAYYIEERVDNLVKREALIKPTKSTVQSDFLIFDKPIVQFIHKQSVILAESISDEFFACATELTKRVIAAGLDCRDRSFDEILCLCALMMLDESAPKYQIIAMKPPKIRYDGGRWDYHGNMSFDIKDAPAGLGMNMNHTEGYAYRVFQFSPFVEAPHGMMCSEKVRICKAILEGTPLEDYQTEQVAGMIADGYLKRNADGSLIPAMPVFDKNLYEEFKRMIADTCGEFLPVYQAKLKAYAAEYVRQFPAHVREQAHRGAFGLFVAMFPRVAAEWQKQGKLNIPDGKVCDVLIEWTWDWMKKD